VVLQCVRRPKIVVRQSECDSTSRRPSSCDSRIEEQSEHLRQKACRRIERIQITRFDESPLRDPSLIDNVQWHITRVEDTYDPHRSGVFKKEGIVRVSEGVHVNIERKECRKNVTRLTDDAAKRQIVIRSNAAANPRLAHLVRVGREGVPGESDMTAVIV